ncbi:hypothetical protein IU433_16810 [Nocardia puris]|uniref:Uncharacterized protein n=1 Tax=Nocardia puris TaxID=208602 RepID=A0A366D0M8_9NOCA|nr:hypothetical protein [Nocardia puris]MBF6211658.1 hypothetical protein [Nocardia puris]MBF6365661.1 hypothetical protein [Nocardia puris]MBF6460696.1 hypothetical protein [Nocardia puris]RBO83014.1 hypothetical protein DFR74_12013 [Nocardia puris]
MDIPDGATACFGGTLSFLRNAAASMFANNRTDLRVHGAQGQDCRVSESALATRSDDGVALTGAMAWTGAAQPKTGTPVTDACRGGGRCYFALEWAHVADGAPERLPVELTVGIEQAVTDEGPAPAESPAPFTAPRSRPNPCR